MQYILSFAAMKKISYSFFFAYVLLSCFSANAQEKKKYQVGVIGFYNLENLFDTINQPNVNDEDFTPDGANRYTAKVYLDKLGKLADVISQIGTDASPDGISLMGNAEIENASVLTDLLNEPQLKKRNYKFVHYDSPDLRGIDVAVIYNPKYFVPKFSEPLMVDLRGMGDSSYYTRDILYVYGEYLGEPVHVMVGHWPSRRGGEEASMKSRAIAAGVVRHKIDSITAINADAKIIFMGDLNDDPVSPSVAKVVGATGDVKQVQRGGMFNPWVKFYNEGIGTLAYNDAWNLFDQVMISSGWLDKNQKGFFYKDAHIFKKEFMLQKTGRYKGYPLRTYDFNRYIGGYSDHFPTYIVMLKAVN